MNKGILVIVLPGVFVTSIGSSSAPSAVQLTGDFTIKVEVNGHPVTLAIDPASPDRPVLNPGFAAQAGIKKSGMIGFRTTVGPIVVWGGTAVTNYAFGSLKYKKRSIIAAKPYVTNADGGAGPGALPYTVVKFSLKDKAPDEQVFVYPLHINATFMDGNSVIDLPTDDKHLMVSFSLSRKSTIATAAAGRLLARVNGGQFIGQPEGQPIAFGIERPVRLMRLARPFKFAGQNIADIGVRTMDYGNATELPEDAQKSVDSDEIVVTAKSTKKDTNRYSIVIGRDDLADCSSIEFDKKAQRIRLSCKPKP